MITVKKQILFVFVLLMCTSCGVTGRMSYRDAYRNLEHAMQSNDLIRETYQLLLTKYLFLFVWTWWNAVLPLSGPSTGTVRHD